jgi:hypothetical protein
MCIIVKKNHALKLIATRDYKDEKKGINVQAGDESLLKGPVTYEHKIYERIEQEIAPMVIGNQEALLIKAN